MDRKPVMIVSRSITSEEKSPEVWPGMKMKWLSGVLTRKQQEWLINTAIVKQLIFSAWLPSAGSTNIKGKLRMM